MNKRIPLGTFFGINTTDGLTRCLDNHAFYWGQLHAFQDEHGRVIRSVMDLLQKRDLDAAEELVHKVKGTAGMLGLEDIQSASHRLDGDLKTACQTGTLPDSVIPEIEAVRQAMERFTDGLEAFDRRMKTA